MHNEASIRTANAAKTSLGRRLRGMFVIVMGCLAILSPFYAGPLALFLVGVLLIVCGVLEMLETFHLSGEHQRRSSYLSGVLSMVAGILLLAQPQLVVRGLALLLAGSFLIDGTGKVVTSLRTKATSKAWKWTFAAGLVNLVLALVLAARWPVSGQGMVAFLVAIRMLTAGWSMLRGAEESPSEVARPLPQRPRFSEHTEFGKLEESLRAEEAGRRWIDAGWCLTFVLVFFAIHVGRMHVEWTPTGMIAPMVAVLGDIATALLMAFCIILPCRLAWRRLTRRWEQRGWDRLLTRKDHGGGWGLLDRWRRVWLTARLRSSLRLAKVRTSPWGALRWGLQVGLPLTAILIAVNPIWGFSWFFNSESWTTGVWDRWAESRTDIWREKMVEAVRADYQVKNLGDDRLFAVEPPGVAASADFSFLVLGDTGEGGLAQASLRDQYLFLGKRPDIKFLVISSDVIYPEGAMRDYEPNFYLPFKGFTQPIYAIPGNHDWYDALEAFAANFLEPDAARATMQARMKLDGWWTTTTPRSIEAKIHEAARLRKEFGVSTGWQRGPFFEIQTEYFALIAVDTGVLRQVDTDQWIWLKAALEQARGKFVLAILGHPLYAGGRYQGGKEEQTAGEWVAQDGPFELVGQRLGAAIAPFAAIHQLLREYRVPVVMAGDTHYFEVYQEPYEANGTAHNMLHFVNGGGGAYLSIGTPMDWPKQPAVPNCAFYPRKDVLIEKLDRETPAWKMPLWSWVKHLGAWPLTAETMAGAFLYNRGPYLQSFVEVRVENSKGQVRFIPHGARGPLHWRDLETFGAVIPSGKTGDDSVEFVLPTTKLQP
jgi:uncharacterized membrane protein HdeD (DUF308 family)